MRVSCIDFEIPHDADNSRERPRPAPSTSLTHRTFFPLQQECITKDRFDIDTGVLEWILQAGFYTKTHPCLRKRLGEGPR